MSEAQAPPPPDEPDRPETDDTHVSDTTTLHALLATIDASVPFGPSFFMTQLRAFVRDRCPDPAEALPSVEIELDTGEIVDVCHVIGVAPHWIALAARDSGQSSAPSMRTELIPYATIRRVMIRPVRPGAAVIGFDREHRPTLFPSPETTAEAALDLAASAPRPRMDR